MDSVRKRVASQGSNRSIEMPKNKGKGFMEDISSRCKEIEERVKLLVNRQKDQRIQRVS